LYSKKALQVPKLGYKQSPQHRLRIGLKAKARPNGWLGRRHSDVSIEKMRRPKSIETREKMRQSAYRRWANNYDKKQEAMVDPRVNPWQQLTVSENKPVVKDNIYRDIFMENNPQAVVSGRDVWRVVDEWEY
jgi:hypothetical protein